MPLVLNMYWTVAQLYFPPRYVLPTPLRSIIIHFIKKKLFGQTRFKHIKNKHMTRGCHFLNRSMQLRGCALARSDATTSGHFTRSITYITNYSSNLGQISRDKSTSKNLPLANLAIFGSRATLLLHLRGRAKASSTRWISVKCQNALNLQMHALKICIEIRYVYVYLIYYS